MNVVVVRRVTLPVVVPGRIMGQMVSTVSVRLVEIFGESSIGVVLSTSRLVHIVVFLAREVTPTNTPATFVFAFVEYASIVAMEQVVDGSRALSISDVKWIRHHLSVRKTHFAGEINADPVVRQLTINVVEMTVVIERVTRLGIALS